MSPACIVVTCEDALELMSHARDFEMDVVKLPIRVICPFAAQHWAGDLELPKTLLEREVFIVTWTSCPPNDMYGKVRLAASLPDAVMVTFRHRRSDYRIFYETLENMINARFSTFLKVTQLRCDGGKDLWSFVASLHKMSTREFAASLTREILKQIYRELSVCI